MLSSRSDTASGSATARGYVGHRPPVSETRYVLAPPCRPDRASCAVARHPAVDEALTSKVKTRSLKQTDANPKVLGHDHFHHRRTIAMPGRVARLVRDPRRAGLAPAPRPDGRAWRGHHDRTGRPVLRAAAGVVVRARRHRRRRVAVGGDDAGEPPGGPRTSPPTDPGRARSPAPRGARGVRGGARGRGWRTGPRRPGTARRPDGGDRCHPGPGSPPPGPGHGRLRRRRPGGPPGWP